MSGTNPNRDPFAGLLLKELREEKRIPRTRLPLEMARAGVPRDHIPSLRTIYNIEEDGQVPRERIRFAIAQFYERNPRDIWQTRTRATMAVAA